MIGFPSQDGALRVASPWNPAYDGTGSGAVPVLILVPVMSDGAPDTHLHVEGCIMTSSIPNSIPPTPSQSSSPSWLLRRLCTSNPLYVVSACLFLTGLWMTLQTQPANAPPWPLMGGLAGYTLLLAATAYLLVQFGNVWDDVRTVLLLVVLMFLAISVTFDEVLVMTPQRGIICYLGGLFFSLVVSEALLRGAKLRLPVGFRLPYFLIVALFFLYPLALRQMMAQESEVVVWGLLGFPLVAGLVFLTLLPAIRQGPDYVQDKDSPWQWPLYPWTLFGLLALAVSARTFLLCWSFHLLQGQQFGQVIFGLYFLVPFGLALAVLLLEMGLVSRHRGVQTLALMIPVCLVSVVILDHNQALVYRQFADQVTARLGGDPLYLTLLGSTGFYLLASCRRLRLALDGLTLTMLALAVVGPRTLLDGELILPRPIPLLFVASLQIVVALRREAHWRFLPGIVCLMAATALTVDRQPTNTATQIIIAFHTGLVAVLFLGAVLSDRIGTFFRLLGSVLVLGGVLAMLVLPFAPPQWIPTVLIQAYPLAMMILLTLYGLMLRYRPTVLLSCASLICWLGVMGWQGYATLRRRVEGLDYLALSVVLLVVAVLISLAKSKVITRLEEAKEQQV